MLTSESRITTLDSASIVMFEVAINENALRIEGGRGRAETPTIMANTMARGTSAGGIGRRMMEILECQE